MSDISLTPNDRAGVVNRAIGQVLRAAVQCQCRVSCDIKAAAAADGPTAPAVVCSRKRQGARASKAAAAKLYIAAALCRAFYSKCTAIDYQLTADSCAIQSSSKR